MQFNLYSLAIAMTTLISLSSTQVFAQDATLAAIEGVLAPDTKITLIKEGFEGTEGPLALADGSLIFTETKANRITRIALDDSISTYEENTNGSNGLGFDPKGRIISVQTLNPRVGVIYPASDQKVFTESFEGAPYQRPNDLVVDKKGNVYFTDSGNATPNGDNKEPPRTAVYFVKADGTLKRLINDVARPNGIQLSRDEKTLYVANTLGEYVLAYDILGEGKLGPKKEFAKLDGIQQTNTGVNSGADGLAIDNEGRLYVASNTGIQVFDKTGKALGNIPLPQKPQNLAFAGKDKKTLYVVGRGAAYKIPVLTPGFKGRAK